MEATSTQRSVSSSSTSDAALDDTPINMPLASTGMHLTHAGSEQLEALRIPGLPAKSESHGDSDRD